MQGNCFYANFHSHEVYRTMQVSQQYVVQQPGVQQVQMVQQQPQQIMVQQQPQQIMVQQQPQQVLIQQQPMMVQQQPQTIIVQQQVPQTLILTQQQTYFGDRKAKQKGKTALANPSQIKLHYNAELKDIGCCTKCYLFCCCGRGFDTKRSYLYIRENSIEKNIAHGPVCCISCCKICAPPSDFVTVQYFDRPPWVGKNQCCCCCKSQPKLEVTKPGCVACFVPLTCCTREEVIFMPYEKIPCCGSNRIGWCENCCGCCGQRTGNPIDYKTFEPQPKNAANFVAVAQQVMVR